MKNCKTNRFSSFFFWVVAKVSDISGDTATIFYAEALIQGKKIIRRKFI
jgi:hypothetical protein